MPTPMDRALQSRNIFFGFAGLVTLASFWSFFGGEMFPAEEDPKGDPDFWTETELRRWLRSRGLGGDGKMTRSELIMRVKSNLKGSVGKGTEISKPPQLTAPSSGAGTKSTTATSTSSSSSVSGSATRTSSSYSYSSTETASTSSSSSHSASTQQSKSSHQHSSGGTNKAVGGVEGWGQFD